MDYLSIVLAILEIFIALTAVASTIYGIYEWIAKPIKNIAKEIDTHGTKINELSSLVDSKVLPIIDSLHREFSVNSGKSIKDQMNRIDNITRLAELRSKLIAGSLLSTGAYECDEVGNCTWTNLALQNLFGLSSEEMLGNGWLVAIDDSDRADVWLSWQNSIKLGIPYEIVYTVNNRKTNQTFKCRASAITHKAIDGKILGYYGTVVRL